MSAYFLSWESEYLYFDVCTSVTHTINSDITEHPVEKGADITDNARPNLDMLTFEAFVSNTPLGDSQTPSFGDLSWTSVPIDPPKPDIPFLPTPGAITNAIGNAIGSLLGSNSPVKAHVIAGSSNNNYVAQVLELLRLLRDTSQIVTVHTSEHTYDSMLLQACDVSRAPGDGTGATVKLAFKQVRIVESKIVNAPEPAMSRAAPVKAMGKQDPVDDGPKSGFLVNIGLADAVGLTTPAVP